MREAHRGGEEEVDPWTAIGGAARGIADADGSRASLFCPGDSVVTRAPWRSETDKLANRYCRTSRNAWTSAVIVVATSMTMVTSSPCPMTCSVEVGVIGAV